MAKPTRRVTPGTDFDGVVGAVQEIQDILGQANVSFGDPTPDAARGQVNGVPDNIWGSWVDVTFTAAATAVVCAHNLDIEVSPSSVGGLNVRWLPFRFEGALTAAPSVYYNGGAVTKDSIELEAQFTVSSGNLEATLFFVPASS